MSITTNKSIEYTLTRTSRKNINITVKNDGFIYVSAPKKVGINDINKVVLSKQEWILNAQKNIKSKKLITHIISPQNNLKFYYYGDLKKLILVPGKKSSIGTLDNYLVFYIKEDKYGDSKYQDDTFRKLLRADLKKSILKYMDKYLPLLNLSVNELEIRSMRTRWGTCIPAKKKILINFNLIYCPKECLEYVVLHELVHFIHPNHSKKFYAEIEKYMPDWKARKNILQNYIIGEG